MEIGKQHSQAFSFLQSASCYQHTSLPVCVRVCVCVCVVWADLSAPGAWKRSLKENRGSLTTACCSGGVGV